MAPLARIFTDSQKSFDLSKFKIEGYQVEPTSSASYVPCDLAVVYGMPKGAGETVALRQDVYSRHKGPLLVVEGCVIGRAFKTPDRTWFSRVFGGYKRPDSLHPHRRLALNAPFGPKADFNNQNSPPDRWERLHQTIRPYRTSGEHILLVGQVPGDSSLRGVDIVDWLVTTAQHLRQVTSREIVVRFHPIMNDQVAKAASARLERITKVKAAPRNQTLSENLENAWATVVFSSGTAIDSLIAGVPAITLSTDNLAYAITSHNLADVDHPPEPDRRQFLYDMAYAQWTDVEFADGTAWRHIAPAVERIGL